MHRLLALALLLAGCAGTEVDSLACPDTTAEVTTSPAAPSHHENVTFRVSGPEALATVWRIDGETVQPQTRFDAPGTHVVEARLFTDEGCVIVATLDLDVQNDAPMAHFSYTTIGDTVYLDARGSDDPNGDPLTYSWSFNGTVVGTGKVQDLAPKPAVGTIIKLVVMDPWGGDDRYQERYS